MLSLRRQDRENRTVLGLYARHHRQRIFLNWAGSLCDVYGAIVVLILAALILGASEQLLFVVERTSEYLVAFVGNDSSMLAFLLMIPG